MLHVKDQCVLCIRTHECTHFNYKKKYLNNILLCLDKMVVYLVDS